VLASGGVKVADAAVLTRTADLMRAGASGIAYGRNVMWARQPTLMTRALLSIVHGDAATAEAITESAPS
jgi:DhnA family fructose-bisphosphate aldolase class Ia